MNFYEKNLEALIKINPILVAKLHAISQNKKYEVFVDEKDPVNVNLYDKDKDFIFYKQKPVNEITQQYEKLMKKYSRYPVVWFYGFSNALLVKMFINAEKKIFLFEPEIELIYIGLNLFDFSKEISEKILNIYHTPDVNYNVINDICVHKDMKALLKIYTLEVILPSYYLQNYFDDIDQINKLFVENIKDVVTQEGNDANDSLIGLDHHLKHIANMLDSYPIQNLKKQKNTQNAVIVSTGPSLAKQLPLLKKYQKYLTIFCIDASLPVLQKEGIAPDFVFSMERVEATSKFFENLDKELLKDTIFMLTSISHPKTINNLAEMKQCISMRPFGYTKSFRLNKWGYIGLGMSAANMAFDFAYIAQYKNIVFIGQDLAFAPDGTTHTKGALYGEKESQYEKQTLYIKGYYGESVKTSIWWALFLATFKRDIPQVKEEGINVYNCTEGGAYIDGATHIPFVEFLESISKEKKEKIRCEKISIDSQKHLLHRSKKLINLYKCSLEEIKEKIEKTFLRVMEQIESLESLNKNNDLEKIDYDSLLEVIEEIDMIKKMYEEHKVLSKFTNITSPFILNAELELARIMVRESDTEIEKKAKLIDWIYEHKSWLFFLAGAIENIIFIIDKN